LLSTRHHTAEIQWAELPLSDEKDEEYAGDDEEDEEEEEDWEGEEEQ
jgi:hypothetical protein